MTTDTITDRTTALVRARQAKKARAEGRLDSFLKDVQTAQPTAAPVAPHSPPPPPVEAVDAEPGQPGRDSEAAQVGQVETVARQSASPFGRFIRRKGMEEPDEAEVDLSDLEDETAEPPTRATDEARAERQASGPVVEAAPAAGNVNERRSSSPYAELARRSAQRRADLEEHDRNRPVGHALRQRSAQKDPPWTDDTVPAGSNYTAKEWADARTPDVWVFEVRNAGQSCLMVVDKPPRPRQSRELVNGKIVTVSEKVPDHLLDATLPAELGSVWDGCMLLAPSADTSHPSAVSGRMTMRTGHEIFGNMEYRIVRPEAHRQTVPWYFGLKGAFEFPGALTALAPVPAAGVDQATQAARTCDDSEAAEFERPRG